jgi:hypothetical protein
MANVASIFREYTDYVMDIFLKLLEHNDNEKNKFSDCVYVGLLLELLGKLHTSDENLRNRRKKMMDQHLQMEVSLGIPSHNGIVVTRYGN